MGNLVLRKTNRNLDRKEEPAKPPLKVYSPMTWDTSRRSQDLRNFLFVLAIVSAGVFLVHPIAQWILLGLVLGLTGYPYYLRLSRRVKTRQRSAIYLTLALVGFIFILAGAFVFWAIQINLFELDTQNIRDQISQWIEKWKTSDIAQELERLGEILPFSFSADQELRDVFKNRFTQLVLSVLEFVSQNLTSLFIALFITVTSFYLFIQRVPQMKRLLVSTFHLERSKAWRLRQHSTRLGFFLIVSPIIAGLAQSAVFLCFAIPLREPLIAWWTMLVFLLSFIPFVGTAPVGLFFVLSHAISQEWLPMALWLLGAGIMGIIDNIVRVLVVGRARIISYPIAVLGIVGGVMTLGAIGVILGPYILGILQVTLNDSPENKTAKQGGTDDAALSHK